MKQKEKEKMNKESKRSNFSGKWGYILAVAGSAVGLGNIWRFPYLAAKYGGGTFLLTYIILTVTFGYALVVMESAMGRLTQKSSIRAFHAFGKTKLSVGGWINAIVPVLIVPYYCVIGGWVVKYLVEFFRGSAAALSGDTYFGEFISKPVEPIVWFGVFVLMTFIVVVGGVEQGIEKVSKLLMPILVVLAVGISIYSVTRPGALAGVKYYLIPDFSKFSIMTVVAALGQMFYSLSLGMGILCTYGSYMKKDIDMEKSVIRIEIMDTLIAFLAGMMIIPAVFAFSGGQQETLNAGPSLMFITLPKVFNSMGLSGVIGVVFFLLVLFAALTSAISLMETVVSLLVDEFHWNRTVSSIVAALEILAIGIPCSLGFGIWSGVTPLGMGILDFFDFITNSLLMPLAAILSCLFVTRVIGLDRLSEEVKCSSDFKREKAFRFCIKYVAPIFLIIILISSILNTFQIISI